MVARRDKILKDAEKLVQKGRVEQAIKEYEKLLKQNPTDANTINRVGDLYGRIGQVDRAIELYERIADHFTQDGFTTKAIAILKKINRLDPQRLDIFDKLAELYIQQGLVVEAKNQFQILADWYSRTGDTAKAVETHRKLVQLDPGNHMAHLRLADLLFQEGEADQAIEVYDRLGRVLLERGKLDEAERLYRHALDQNPPDGEFVAPLCEALLEGGRIAQAREVLEAAFEISRDSYTLQSLKVRTSLSVGESDDAVELARSAADARPDSPMPRVLLGRALLKTDRHDEAREVLVPAARELLVKGEIAPAQEALRELLELYPEDAEILGLSVRAYRPSADEATLRELMMRLADVQFHDGDHDQAQRLYMELLTADPSNQAARKRLAEIQQVEPDQVSIEAGAAARDEEEVPEIVEIEAPELTGGVVVDEPRDFDVEERLNEAKVFAKYGLLDKAASHLEDVLARDQDHVEARQSLVDLHLDRGDAAAALEVARPLYRLYTEAGNGDGLNRLVKLLPDLEGRPAVAGVQDLDDDVIVLDLDAEVELEPEAAGIGSGAAEAAAEAASEDDAVVIDLDAVAEGAPTASTEVDGPAESDPAVVPPAQDHEPVPAPGAGGPSQAELSQLDSFIEQELAEDAIRLLGRLEDEYPEHPAVGERRAQLKAKGVLLEEVAATPSAGPEVLFADEEESFVDLAKELEAELAEEEALVEEATGAGKEEAILEEVFREFQRGVEEQLSEEDSDTHFNLGIAYKEMGLLPEAIREFQVSARNPELFVECCSMIGVCYMDQGMWSQAAEWYQKALGAPDLTPEAQLALRYDLAASLESAGEVQRAMGLYQEVVELNPAYRDVSTRLDELSQQSGQIN
jgi:tetratricopeptide (TPR) repeat protein